jgi:hypothetical protein
VFEDIYISLYKTDGFESTFKLRSRITDRVARRRTGELPKSDEMLIPFYDLLETNTSE